MLLPPRPKRSCVPRERHKLLWSSEMHQEGAAWGGGGTLPAFLRARGGTCPPNRPTHASLREPATQTPAHKPKATYTGPRIRGHAPSHVAPCFRGMDQAHPPPSFCSPNAGRSLARRKPQSPRRSLPVVTLAEDSRGGRGGVGLLRWAGPWSAVISQGNPFGEISTAKYSSLREGIRMWLCKYKKARGRKREAKGA